MSTAPGIRRHSGPGIASLAIGLSAGAITFGLILYAQFELVGHRITIDMKSPTALILALSGMLFPVVVIIGLGLGIAGVAQRSRRRFFATIGLCINTAFVICFVALLAVAVSRMP